MADSLQVGIPLAGMTRETTTCMNALLHDADVLGRPVWRPDTGAFTLPLGRLYHEGVRRRWLITWCYPERPCVLGVEGAAGLHDRRRPARDAGEPELVSEVQALRQALLIETYFGLIEVIGSEDAFVYVRDTGPPRSETRSCTILLPIEPPVIPAEMLTFEDGAGAAPVAGT
jgi:hypothetical protein